MPNGSNNGLDFVFLLGRPFSPFYTLAMRLRAGIYRSCSFTRNRVDAPVISVGNLVLGGSGKTPVVQHIATLLAQNGYKPAVISRGYRGKAKNPVNIVSDRSSVLLSPAEAGDEPSMLAEALPGIPVLTGKKRIFPARYAIENFDADVIILDDAFQHLSIERDIDIVLFDATIQAGNSRVFPGGHLREPVSALNRAHAFLITGKTPVNKERGRLFGDLLTSRFPSIPIFSTELAEQEPEQSSVSQTLHHPVEVSDGNTAQNYFGFCGIANPERFQRSLDTKNLSMKGFWPLADHQNYTQPLLDKICAKAKEAGADSLITTAKDHVKLRHLKAQLPVYILRVNHSFDVSFDNFLLSRLTSLQ